MERNRLMVLMGAKLLALNSSYARRGRDPVGRAVATVAVPSIQTHLTILRGLKAV